MEKEEKYRVPHAKQQLMKEYMFKVHDQHLPRISIEKIKEREKNIHKQESNKKNL